MTLFGFVDFPNLRYIGPKIATTNLRMVPGGSWETLHAGPEMLEVIYVLVYDDVGSVM